MRSSTGTYYPGLDHLRALAAFLVFGWHFSHGFTGSPAPFGSGATPFFAPFNEGHCGVALFMCLSGYLFAGMLDGKEVIWRRFYWNRFIRLAPLVIAVAVLPGAIMAASQPAGLENFAISLLTGFLKPTWLCGAWSVTVEIHFYLLLWIIIPLKRRWPLSLLGFLALGAAARMLIYAEAGDVEYYAYLTIIGRLDQFILGIAAWHFRDVLKGRHAWMGLASLAYFGFYQWFAGIGGFYGTQGTHAVWIFLPTIDAVFFSFLVVWYDTSFTFRRTWYWRLIEVIGTVSFSIYLLHSFVVFALAKLADRLVPGMATWEVAEAMAIPAFLIFLPFAWLSYRFVELPFLRFRTQYTRADSREPEATPMAAPSKLAHAA